MTKRSIRPIKPRVSPSSLYLSSAEAALLAKVAPSSVKRWADEGLLACSRTVGGHRRFLRRDVERFIAEHQAQAADAGQADAEHWLTLLLKDDSYALQGALFSRRSQLGAWHRVADGLGPALGLLGEKWQRGEVTLFEEHLCSERLHRALAQVARSEAASPSGPVCLLATPEGEEHTLGLSLAELCLGEAGWSALWAGRGMPNAQLVRIVSSGRVAMVALSASQVKGRAPKLLATARAVGKACKRRQLPLVVGGQGAWPEGDSVCIRLSSFSRFHELLRERAGATT